MKYYEYLIIHKVVVEIVTDNTDNVLVRTRAAHRFERWGDKFACEASEKKIWPPTFGLPGGDKKINKIMTERLLIFYCI